MENEKPKKRRMSVIEIGGGQLYKELQDAFDDALKLSEKNYMKCAFSAQITIHPARSVCLVGGTIKTGQIEFEIKPASIKKKSMQYETEVDEDGYIIAQGNSVMDLIQEDMGDVLMADVKSKVAQFNKKVVSNG
jgi:hypothetical protein